MKKSIMIAVLFLFNMQVFAVSDSASRKTASAIEGILAKTGISVGGEFRSQYLSSEIGDTGAVKSRRSIESAEFTSVDFDIKARPNTVTQGRVIFRMHQDWRNFFSDIANPIHTRWLSIDGSVKRMFSYNVGDFKQKYTELTLYSPEIELLYEPELFKKDADVAKAERFLEDNQRVLQGINCNFAAEVTPIFNSLKIGVLGSRLRNVHTNLANGDMPTNAVEDTLIEKFLFASTLDATFLKAFSIGGNFLDFFDNKGSFYQLPRVNPTYSDSIIDTMANKTWVGDFRGAIDIHELLKSSSFKATVSAEAAFSNDDSAWYHIDSVLVAGVNTPVKKRSNKNIPGQAIRAGLNANYTGSDLFSIGLSAFFLNTGKEYRNELAQSPSFLGHRIMNIDNDNIAGNQYDVNSQHYSTFDAMYMNVYKFTARDNTNRFFMAPMSKNAYYSTIYTHAELMNMVAQGAFDPSLQLVMPFGPATPNRTGVDMKLNLGFLKNKIEAKVLFASLKEIDPLKVSDSVSYPLTAFGQAGGGAKVDIGNFIGWQYPFYLSGSFVNSSAKNDGNAADSLDPVTVTSGIACGDLYFKFWKRAALLCGFEKIGTEFNSVAGDTTTQLYYAGGLEYKLSDGSYLTGKIGQIKVGYGKDEVKDAVSALFSEEKPSVSGRRFSQAIVNLFLTVKF